MMPHEILNKRVDMAEEVMSGKIHPQQAAQNFNQYILEAIATAPANWGANQLVWMAQLANSFNQWCREQVSGTEGS